MRIYLCPYFQRRCMDLRMGLVRNYKLVYDIVYFIVISFLHLSNSFSALAFSWNSFAYFLWVVWIWIYKKEIWVLVLHYLFSWSIFCVHRRIDIQYIFYGLVGRYNLYFHHFAIELWYTLVLFILLQMRAQSIRHLRPSAVDITYKSFQSTHMASHLLKHMHRLKFI